MKYSIVLPVRNGGKHVKTCVNSILAQRYNQFTLHVLDNNSTDGTREWITSLGDERIQVYPGTKDLSIEENWARIKDIEKNEFITLIGHDDVLKDNYLEVMDRMIRDHPGASLFQSHFDFIDAEDKFIRTCKPMPERFSAGTLIEALFTRTMDTMGTGYMMRAADYDKLGGISPAYPYLLFADDELWIKLTSLGYMAVAQDNCFQYRRHKSASQTVHPEVYHKGLAKYIDFIQEAGRQKEDVRKSAMQNGQHLLITYARMISHYLLRVPLKKRNYTVASYLRLYQPLNEKICPGKKFRPLRKPGILLAALIDSNPVTRFLFKGYLIMMRR